MASTTKRVVRGFLRYLEERVGSSAYEAMARELPPASAALLADRGLAGSGDWVPLDDWLLVLRRFEARFGDPATLQLLRETTRAAMATALSKGWSTFLADVTPDQLLQRSNTFWSMSYDSGRLEVRARGARRCRMAVVDWNDPPPEVGAMFAEACVVFLVRLGERSPRVVEERSAGGLELDVTW